MDMPLPMHFWSSVAISFLQWKADIDPIYFTTFELCIRFLGFGTNILNVFFIINTSSMKW